MIKVIHLFTTLDNGGVESFLYNYYSHMNRESIQFDFIVAGDNHGYLEPIMSKMNSNIFHVTKIRECPIMHIIQIYHILKNGSYDIIHCHGYKSFIGLIVGKLLGCNVRIIHSYMAFIDENLREFLYRKFAMIISKLFATNFFACGIDAAVWLFGLSDYRANKIEIINNAIDLQKYTYNASARLKLRCELNLKDYFVIGNIGRLTQQKNQSWLLVLLHQLRSQNLPIKLVLVGNGEDDAKLKEECKKLKLQDSVFFRIKKGRPGFIIHI